MNHLWSGSSIRACRAEAAQWPNTTACRTQNRTFTYLIYKILVSSEPRYVALKADCKEEGASISMRIKITLNIGIRVTDSFRSQGAA